MSYPGNISLSQETKERITSTFHQTLDLAKEGRLREAVLGCDFILRMDPLFHPARTLQERLQAGEASVLTSDLDSRPGGEEPSSGSSFETMHLDASQISQLEVPGSLPSAGGDVFGHGAEPLPDLDAADEDLLRLDPEPPLTLSPQSPSTPPMPPKAPSRPSGAGRIEELLEEGQAAFDGGEFQKAIDAWSRIFLIDIDHQEAAQRIEQARKFKAERERQVDLAMHEAMEHREAGRIDEARRGFEKILQLQPTHITAREQLSELDQGMATDALPPLRPAEPTVSPRIAPPAFTPPPGAPAGGPAAPPQPVSPPSVVAPSVAPPQSASGSDDLGGDSFGGSEPGFADDLYEGGAIDSFAEEAPEFAAPPPATERPSGGAAKPQRSFLLIGVLVLIVAGAAGWYLYGRWGSIFPNAEEPVVAEATVDVVQRATRLRLAGNTEGALEELQQLSPDHPAYARAQILIEQWSSEVEPAAAETMDVDTEEAERLSRREALLQRARQAYSAREYLPAAKAFKAADDLEPLEGASADLYEDTKRQLRPIATQIDLFQQREWEMVVPMLWRKLEEDPDNRDLNRMLADSYFNLGVRDLRRGVPRQAQGRFEEAVSISPDDQMAQRLLQFSVAYATNSRDVLYDIYVKQLRYRR